MQTKLNLADRGAEFDGERNDCTVWAVANAAGMPYSAAHRELELAGRKPRHGFRTAEFIIYKNNRIANYQVVRRYEFDGHTLGRVRWRFLSGRYLVRVRHHLFSVVDGVELNTVHGPRKKVTAVWELRAL